MLKKSLVVFTAVSLLSLPVSAQSSFTELVVFGDSLMDTGNADSGQRFTNETSPGVFAPIAPEFLADDLGLTLTPAIDGGTNYAVGGFQTGHVFQSIAGTGIATNTGTANAYLTNVGGAVPSGALILIDGGGNDLNAIAQGDPANAPTAINAAATTYIQSIGSLAAAGANYIMVANVPNLGITPIGQAADADTPGSADGLVAVTEGFNDGVETLAALQLSDVNIIPVDINGVLEYVFENADKFGFANGDLDLGFATIDQLSLCYDASEGDCIEHPTYGKNGAAPNPRALVFNDSLHPTEATSEIFGDYLIDIIKAPQTIGLLPELALVAARSQSAVIGDELRRSRWSKPQGRLFVAGEMVTDEYENIVESESENTSLTVGRTFVASESLVYGLALSLAEQELDVDGADIESESWSLSGMFGYRQDKLFVDAAIALSVLSYDGIKREINLGVDSFNAQGDTEGHAWTIDGLVGYDLFGSNPWHLAPALGMQYINTAVDGYSETGGGVSNYAWGEQRRKSLVWRYGIVGSGQLTHGIRVFGEIFGAQEQEGEDETISICNTNLGYGSYELPSFQAQDDSYITAAVGGSISISDQASLNLSLNYSDRGDGYKQIILSYSMPL